MSDLRDLLKGQSISSTTPGQLSQVGGPVFLDSSAIASLNDLVKILDAWRSVRVPTYGTPIPGTGDTAVAQFEVLNTIKTVFAPSSGEVAFVQMITVQNAGGAPLTLDLFLTDQDGTNIDVLDDLVLGPGDVVNLMTQSSLAFPQFSADESLQIRGRVVAGTPGDCYVKVNYILTAQA
jgi:hypothetical protein